MVNRTAFNFTANMSDIFVQTEQSEITKKLSSDLIIFKIGSVTTKVVSTNSQTVRIVSLNSNASGASIIY